MCQTITFARQVCADWEKGTEPTDDPILKGKKDLDPEHPYQYKITRYLGLSNILSALK